MKHVYKIVALAGASLALGACSTIVGENGYLRDQGGDYVKEKMSPDLKIPASLDAVTPAEYLVVPEITNKASVDGLVVPRADRRIVQDDGIAYQIVQQASGGRVLMVERAPAVVWSFMTRFWDSNNIPLIEQDATRRVMETDWVQLGEKSNPGMMRQLFGKVIDLENSEVYREKFRLTISQGERSGNSQVLLQHVRRSVDADMNARVNWNSIKPGASSIDEELLNEMMMFMVQNRQEQSVSQLAQKIDISDQTSLTRDGNGIPVLNIAQGFARSWQAVESALQKTGVKITDRNRTAGLIYVVFSEGKAPEPVDKEGKDKKESGWFGNLFSSSDEQPPEAESSATSHEYRLRVRGVGDSTQVTLEKDLNTLPPAGVSEQFLERLRNNLS